MTHKFKVMNKSKLDSERRREVLPAKKILDAVGIKRSDIVADIGCGIGFFTVPLSEAVGDQGVVYALDIEKEMLDDVENKMLEYNIKNVRPVVTQEYKLTLEDGCVGVAFLSTVMHEVKMREKFLKEANRILFPDGRIIIIEWIKKDCDYGPPADHRLDQDTLKRNLQRTGFKEITIMDFNEYFYIASAMKK
ncbi:class I SAM-dependent methyltransferase [Clostridium sp. E02]|uniref:class I SAM-dependent methyltransferase n=1 Tax=Clostridium sp. E02 TaxID=2487134 RepID=UPI000F531374|nr:class I SAM-dependent methyltransferase [Clostridium sp. E02]